MIATIWKKTGNVARQNTRMAQNAVNDTVIE